MDIEGILNQNINNVFFFSKNGCVYCDKLEKGLTDFEIPFTKITLSFPEEKAELVRITKCTTFPQLFFGKGDFVGGFSEFEAMSCTSKLQEHLNKLGITCKLNF